MIATRFQRLAPHFRSLAEISLVQSCCWNNIHFVFMLTIERGFSVTFINRHYLLPVLISLLPIWYFGLGLAGSSTMHWNMSIAVMYSLSWTWPGLWSRDQVLISRPEKHDLSLGLGPFDLGLGLGLMTRGSRSRPRPQFKLQMLVLESFLDQCESFRNHDSLHGAIITLITVHCECNVWWTLEFLSIYL
jgi:hypothetical protein